ncbi:MAG: hypothetical protein HY553_17900 [Elusimicrobia bacterium]|nr:hypothetical protein [Elusimicrobiota bacterium]
MKTLHYAGIAGSGMSALAQFHAMGGGAATGSDRSFDRGLAAGIRAKLEAQGVRIVPQDGSGVRARPDAVIASTAIETDNPDLEAARGLGIPVIHRADMLARYVAERRAVAVAGTSGKSTVAAMVYEILLAAGRDPSVITGGGLRALESQGLIGNARRGGSDLLVIEADESDGTLVRYAPAIGVLLNVDKDHKEIPELVRMFSEFKSRCGRFVSHAGSPGIEGLAEGARTFGLGDDAQVRAEDVRLEADGSRFRVSGVEFRLPVPGRHNVENAVAATAAALEAGAELASCARALEAFQGVARRFERVGAARGVAVIDDFAHNPAKVRAAIETARLQAPRVLAIFQPHGYAPTRFNRQEFIDAFAAALRSGDVLWLPEIYYAGGTAQKTISSKDLADPVRARGKDARFVERRAEIPAQVAAEARSGDVVLTMGARDPSLGEFARELLAALEK